MSPAKTSIAFLGFPPEKVEAVAPAVPPSYSVVAVQKLEELADISPIAVVFPFSVMEFPLPPWIERVRFLSGGAELFLLTQSGPGKEQWQAIYKQERQGSLCCLPPESLGSPLFQFLLRKLTRYDEQFQQLTGMKSMVETGLELQKELEFRTKALERQKEFTANIISSITSGLIVIDVEGTVVTLNSEAASILQVTKKDYLASHFTEVFNARTVEVIVNFTNHVSGTKTRATDLRLAFSDDLILFWKCYPILNHAQHFLGSLHLIEDITNQEEMEKQLLQAEKLATIGTMLGGVAHELRNPLAIISGRVQRLLSRKSQFDEWALRYLNSIFDQSVRCGGIVNNLLNLSRRETGVFDYHSIDAILDEVLTYVDYQNAFDRIEVIKDYAPKLSVFCDRSQLVQVFLNIVTNAADAMEGEGSLTLRTALDSNRAIISFADTGPGIDSKHLKKVFDPFFTTKEAGKGTGLGLPIAYKIIQQHGGDIRVRSHPGQTLFEVVLPLRK